MSKFTDEWDAGIDAIFERNRTKRVARDAHITSALERFAAYQDGWAGPGSLAADPDVLEAVKCLYRLRDNLWYPGFILELRPDGGAVYVEVQSDDWLIRLTFTAKGLDTRVQSLRYGSKLGASVQDPTYYASTIGGLLDFCAVSVPQ